MASVTSKGYIKLAKTTFERVTVEIVGEIELFEGRISKFAVVKKFFWQDKELTAFNEHELSRKEAERIDRMMKVVDEKVRSTPIYELGEIQFVSQIRAAS